MKLHLETIFIATLLICSCSEKRDVVYGNWSSLEEAGTKIKFRNKLDITHQAIIIEYYQNQDICYLTGSSKYHWSTSTDSIKTEKKYNGELEKYSAIKISKFLEQNNKYVKNISMNEFSRIHGNSGIIKIDVSEYFSDMRYYKKINRSVDYGYLSIIMAPCSSLETEFLTKSDPEIEFYIYNIRFKL